MNPNQSELHFDDDTMDKVYDVMRDGGGLTEKQTRNLLRLLRAEGFVFREKKAPAPNTPVYRGVQEEAVPVATPPVLEPEPYPAPNFPTDARGFANYLGQVPTDGR